MDVSEKKKISLLYPEEYNAQYKIMSDVTMHDLGFDVFCKQVTPKEIEQNLFMKVLAKMTDDIRVTNYRIGIFQDISSNPELCEKLMEILGKINFLHDYGSFKRKFDENAGLWDLMHRLEEINDYITYVETIYQCLSGSEIKSKGMKDLREYVDKIYHDNGYDALKKDIAQMKLKTSEIKSVTVGINLNSSFDATGIGLISVNSKQFTKSNVLENFYDKITSKGPIRTEADWDGSYRFHPIYAEDGGELTGKLEGLAAVSMAYGNPLYAKNVAKITAGDSAEQITRYMDRVTNQLLSVVVKNLRDTLNKYVNITISDITDLIPEFQYYISMSEYIKGLKNNGFTFCNATTAGDDADCHMMQSKGIYNLKLAMAENADAGQVVTNDLSFDTEHLVYLLTGANRGGKTTITQAVGQLFVLAQGGLPVPASEFVFKLVDGVYTHFPADEDKTLDLGRLGEECKRFKDQYQAASSKSLILLNETFSTTSFEEGYYIARDSVRAILNKGIRCIYNTHMHKLAHDIDTLNDNNVAGKAVSLVVKSDNGKRSFKVELAPPEGMSYAEDIANKYGVTYEMLTGK